MTPGYDEYGEIPPLPAGWDDWSDGARLAFRLREMEGHGYAGAAALALLADAAKGARRRRRMFRKATR